MFEHTLFDKDSNLIPAVLNTFKKLATMLVNKMSFMIGQYLLVLKLFHMRSNFHPVLPTVRHQLVNSGNFYLNNISTFPIISHNLYETHSVN